MSLGVVCHYLDQSFKNILGHRKVRKCDYDAGKYDRNRLLNVYYNNVDAQTAIINRLKSEGISCYRMSSELLPLIDIVSDDIKYDPVLASKLKSCGDAIKRLNMRAVFHPDQFCVLSSDNPNVVQNAVRFLEIHAWMMDTSDTILFY